ncbi:MAG: STAS domain-containing protein [Actinomycetota bacterium]
MPNWFSINVRYGTAACAISCAGELDASNVSKVVEAVSLCIERGAALVILDCRDVSFADSTGIETLLHVRRRCRQNGTGFRLIPGERITDVAERAGKAEELGLPSRTVRLAPVERLDNAIPFRRRARKPIVLRTGSTTAVPPSSV